MASVYTMAAQAKQVREAENARDKAYQTGMESVEAMIQGAQKSLEAKSYVDENDNDDITHRDQAEAFFLAAAVTRIKQESVEVQTELMTFLTGVKNGVEA